MQVPAVYSCGYLFFSILPVDLPSVVVPLITLLPYSKWLLVPDLARFTKDIQKRLPDLDLKGKCLALDMLAVKIYIDGENVETKGTIDTSSMLTH
jgi:hypothetical protein